MGGSILIIGASIGSAPRSESRSTRSAACAFGLVTRILLPKSGLESNQLSRFPNSTTEPTTKTVGPCPFVSRAAF